MSFEPEQAPPVLPFVRVRRPVLTYALLAAMIAGFAVQLAAQVGLGDRYFTPEDESTFLYYLCPSRGTVAERPWTLVTSIFAHGGLLHLLVNLIVYISFSPMLELRIGKAKFAAVFFFSGVAAALAQLLVSPPHVIILGASGAILGLLGTLAVLAPRLPVLLFFFIPMRLWMAVGGFAVISALLAFTLPQSSVANLAHLVGIIVGVLFGIWMKKRERRRMHLYLYYPAGLLRWEE